MMRVWTHPNQRGQKTGCYGSMATVLWTHRYDLSIDQLNPIARPKHACLDHTLILRTAKTVAV